MSGKIVRPHASVFACGVFVCAVGCGVYSSGEKTRMSDSATRRLRGRRNHSAGVSGWLRELLREDAL